MKKYIVYELFDGKVAMSENELFYYYNRQSVQVKSKYQSFELWLKKLFSCGLLEINQ